MFDVDC